MRDLNQAIIDACVAVYNQGSQSIEQVTDAACAYRGANGCKCIIGHMINDDAYDVSLEGHTIHSSAVINALVDSDFIRNEIRKNFETLVRLQRAHDAHLDDSDPSFRETFIKRIQSFNPEIHKEVCNRLNIPVS